MASLEAIQSKLSKRVFEYFESKDIPLIENCKVQISERIYDIFMSDSLAENPTGLPCGVSRIEFERSC